MVYDKNSIFVTHYNPIQSIYEIWVVELFSNKIENSLVSILEDYLF